MLDFIVIFSEGLVFFILAVLISNTKAFFTILAVLFIIDAFWVWLTKLTGPAQEPNIGPNYTRWAVINIIVGIVILIQIWSNLLNWSFWKTETAQIIALVSLAVIRTALDYAQVWKFYYPLPNGVHDVLPAPLPAPVPMTLIIRKRYKKEDTSE